MQGLIYFRNKDTMHLEDFAGEVDAFSFGLPEKLDVNSRQKVEKKYFRIVFEGSLMKVVRVSAPPRELYGPSGKNRIKVMHQSDTHFGYLPYPHYLNEYYRRTFAKDLRDCDIFVHSGDLFERSALDSPEKSKRMVIDGSAYVAFLKEYIGKEGKPLVFTNGNHCDSILYGKKRRKGPGPEKDFFNACLQEMGVRESEVYLDLSGREKTKEEVLEQGGYVFGKVHELKDVLEELGGPAENIYLFGVCHNEFEIGDPKLHGIFAGHFNGGGRNIVLGDSFKAYKPLIGRSLSAKKKQRYDPKGYGHSIYFDKKSRSLKFHSGTFGSWTVHTFYKGDLEHSRFNIVQRNGLYVVDIDAKALLEHSGHRNLSRLYARVIT